LRRKPQPGGVAVPEGDGGRGLGRVGEAHQLGQRGNAVPRGDLAQHPAGGHRGQLLRIADQPDAATAPQDVLGGPGQLHGASHAGLVNDDQRARPDVGVLTGEVGQAADGWVTADAGVGPMVVVGLQPTRKGRAAVGFAGEELGEGPFAGRGAVEVFDLAEAPMAVKWSAVGRRRAW
jgi:hypothetical protein